MNRFLEKRRRGGFTLMEVLLVLVILVILASFAVGAYGPMKRKAKVDAAKAQVGLFKSPLQMYEESVGSLPTTSQGLNALRRSPGDLPNNGKWDGPYLESEVPQDPWGHQYQYASPGSHNSDSYDVWSPGPDGVSGTSDDIGNW
jgi:general secretion pathway protein G